MAMNKKERAAFEEALTSAAFYRTPQVFPDVLPPEAPRELRTGFVFNAYTRRVDVACTSFLYHGIGRTDKTTAQGARALYSTKALALKALRYALEQEMAQQLRAIDIQIEQETKEETE